jgi:hypothetical protein
MEIRLTRQNKVAGEVSQETHDKSITPAHVKMHKVSETRLKQMNRKTGFFLISVESEVPSSCYSKKSFLSSNKVSKSKENMKSSMNCSVSMSLTLCLKMYMIS